MSGLQSPAGEKDWVIVAPYAVSLRVLRIRVKGRMSAQKPVFLWLKSPPLLCLRTHVLRKAGQYSVAPSVFPPSPSPALNQAAP